ncbi:MAG: glycoside hydrolase family 2 [Verrucomicrobiales bacterium]|nr:glycoside hydrolase family 2 [Verrucomicrobiales bacterium]
MIKHRGKVIVSGLFCITLFCATAGAWTLQKAPIMTKWAAEVDPKNPLPEYPRPQLTRPDWLSLNGIWQFQKGDANDQVPFGKVLSGDILVPFPVESAISGVMQHYDRLWYRRTFSVPAAWKDKQIILHFGAVDYESEVYLNGKSLGIHKGGYDPFSYDITPYLKEGEQELIVRVYDPTEAGGQPRGKQTTAPGGIMYTPTTGIWQTVWLEPISAVSVENIKLVPDLDKLTLTVKVKNAEGVKLAISVKDGGKVVKAVEGDANREIQIPISNPKLWSPEHPFLYNLAISVSKDGKVSDQVGSYFGLRKVELREVNGVKKVFLNGEFVYQVGVLDQGFWPDGIYTQPTEEALKFDIEQMKALGFNMVRKHIKVEPARWYYWTDKLGLLVWQDMPSENSYIGKATPPPLDKEEYQSELRQMVQHLYNVPSIITWVIFNESQGQFDVRDRKERTEKDVAQGRSDTGRLVNMVRELDKTRLINEASGDENFGLADMNDRHSYPPPNCPENKYPNQALFCGEYGGIGYFIKEHSWVDRGSGYANVESGNDLVFMYADFFEKIRKFRDEQGMSGSVYTELTDVMTEVNGFLTYDRVPKCDFALIKKINEFKFVPPTYQPILSTAEQGDQTWKYTTEKPGGPAWQKIDFDDSKWSEGKAGFGQAYKTISNTPWKTPDIWLRRTFDGKELTTEQIANLMIRIYHDDGAEVFINGVQAYANGKTLTAYEYRGLKQAARDAINANGKNVIAIHCANKLGGQHIDAGLYVRVPSQN